MDKEKILQGRGVIQEYQMSHRELHAKPWTRDVPEQHTPLINKMKEQLQRLGFSTLEDFSQADKELQGIEYNEYLPSLSLTPSKPLRLLDASSFSLPIWCALQEILPKLRLEDKIPDTLLFRYLQGGHYTAVIGGNSNEAIAFKARCEQLGIEYCRNIPSVRGVIYRDDVLSVLITKDRFLSLDDTWDALLSVVVKTLKAVGVVEDISVSGNGVEVLGKKVVMGIKRSYRDVYRVSTTTYQDFDYTLGAQVFDQPDIRDRVTTLKEVLGGEVPMEEFKTTFTQASLQTFSSPITEEQLTSDEESLLSYLLPKYESEAWNERGESDRVLIEQVEMR